jgi:hypothetical protein
LGDTATGVVVFPGDWKPANGVGVPSASYMADRSPSSSDASTSGGGVWIVHTVSKLDTLAGVAIKYGVEVCSCFRGVRVYV